MWTSPGTSPSQSRWSERVLSTALGALRSVASPRRSAATPAGRSISNRTHHRTQTALSWSCLKLCLRPGTLLQKPPMPGESRVMVAGFCRRGDFPRFGGHQPHHLQSKLAPLRLRSLSRFEATGSKQGPVGASFRANGPSPRIGATAIARKLTRTRAIQQHRSSRLCGRPTERVDQKQKKGLDARRRGRKKTRPIQERARLVPKPAMGVAGERAGKTPSPVRYFRFPFPGNQLVSEE